jgi:phosphohistidine phosphatase SixA
MINRRKAIERGTGLAAAGWVVGPWAPAAWAQNGDAATLLRGGACAVVLRHAETDPGVGDPSDFDLAQCSTQRNLSEAGRTQARQIGQWFSSRKLQPAAVLASAWCRCKDTADLAFGTHTLLPALNSTFGSRSNQAEQTAALRARLASVPRGRFEVWVTHQVNISDLTSAFTGMGEAVIVDATGKMRLRSRFE